MGAAAVGATIYFGCDESQPADRRSRARPSRPRTSWAWSPSSGATCATRRSRPDGVDYHIAADLTGQANHLGVTIEADIIKQKLPEGTTATAHVAAEAGKYGKTNAKVYSELTTDNPIDLTPLPGRQLLHGPRAADQLAAALSGESDLAEAVRTAVINKRAGGMGLISRPQGVPAPDGGGRRAAERDPGRLPVRRGHDRVRS